MPSARPRRTPISARCWRRSILRLGNFAYAEREARAARDLNGPEAEYILTLAEAMMRQGKFADIPAEIKPGNRAPELESKIRVVLGLAANALRDPVKAEALLREAVSLDPNAAAAKLTLAKMLLRGKPGEAEKIVDEVLAAEPKSAEAIALKGEMLGCTAMPKARYSALTRRWRSTRPTSAPVWPAPTSTWSGATTPPSIRISKRF